MVDWSWNAKCGVRILLAVPPPPQKSDESPRWFFRNPVVNNSTRYQLFLAIISGVLLEKPICSKLLPKIGLPISPFLFTMEILKIGENDFLFLLRYRTPSRSFDVLEQFGAPLRLLLGSPEIVGENFETSRVSRSIPACSPKFVFVAPVHWATAWSVIQILYK